jgi:hypothetical protein
MPFKGNLGSEAGQHCALLVVIVGFTTMPTNHLLPIEDWQKKQLLVHIEEAGGLGVANFKTICDSNPAIFGSPGRNSIRRQFQKELSNCLKRNLRNYLKLLSYYNITPSEQAIARAETGLSNVIVFGLRLLHLFAHLSFLQVAVPMLQPWVTAVTKKNLRKVSFRQ